jgi:hypothetical protein
LEVLFPPFWNQGEQIFARFFRLNFGFHQMPEGQSSSAVANPTRSWIRNSRGVGNSRITLILFTFLFVVPPWFLLAMGVAEK